MTVFDTLLAPVIPILQQIEAERKKHHNETFLWIDFARILVFYFTKRCGSLNALIVALENADPALGVPHVPKMTLSDAFRRFPVSPPKPLGQARSRDGAGRDRSRMRSARDGVISFS